MSRHSQGNIGRTLRKLELTLREKQYYETHQQCMTLWRRYTSDGNQQAACSLVLRLLPIYVSVGEYGSAEDLVRTAIDSFADTPHERAYLTQFFIALEPCIKQENIGNPRAKKTYDECVRALQRWSAKHGYTHVEPAVGHSIAVAYMTNGWPYDAEGLLLRLPNTSAQALRILGESLERNSAGTSTTYFYLRWVLFLVASGRVGYALTVLSWKTTPETAKVGGSAGGKIDFVFYDDENLDFAQAVAVLVATPNKAQPSMDVAAFNELTTHYGHVIRADQTITELVDTIAKKCFRIGVQGPNLFEQLMQGMM